MDIKNYLKTNKISQSKFAKKIKVTQGFISRLILNKTAVPFKLCITVEKATNRQVTCEELRPDIDWSFLRH